VPAFTYSVTMIIWPAACRYFPTYITLTISTISGGGLKINVSHYMIKLKFWPRWKWFMPGSGKGNWGFPWNTLYDLRIWETRQKSLSWVWDRPLASIRIGVFNLKILWNWFGLEMHDILYWEPCSLHHFKKWHKRRTRFCTRVTAIYAVPAVKSIKTIDCRYIVRTVTGQSQWPEGLYRLYASL